MSAASSLSIGDVLTTTTKAVGGNLATCVLLSAIFAAGPAAVANALVAQVHGQWSHPAAQIVGALAIQIPSAVAIGAIIHATYMQVTGQRASLSQALRTGLAHFAPLAAVEVLYTVGTFAGLLFFLVPALFMLVTWPVVGPVQVIENTGVFAPFDRSASLTEGRRWKVLAVILLVTVFLATLRLGLWQLSSVLGELSPGLKTSIRIGVSAVNSIVGTVIHAAVAAVLYVELRRCREGVIASTLSQVFD